MANATNTTDKEKMLAKVKAAGDKFDINAHTFRVFMNEPFFASISRRVDKRKDASMPTLGVSLDKSSGRFMMFYNPYFCAGLSDSELASVIMHEFYHLIFEHVTTRCPDDPKEHYTFNIGADLAINSLLKDSLPTKCWGEDLKLCIPGEDKFSKYPEGKNMEWYVRSLKEDKDHQKDADEHNKNNSSPGNGSGEPCDACGGTGQEATADGEGTQACGSCGGSGQKSGNGNGGQGDGMIGSHDKWSGENAGAAASAAKATFKDILGKTVADVQKGGKGWGTMPADCQARIIEMLKSKVDWKQLLRYFVGQANRADRRSTVKKLNRRYRYIHPGKHQERHANIAFCLDMSGSVSDDLLQALFAEAEGLSKRCTITIVPFDTEVQKEHVEEWKKGQRHQGKRVKYGGTNFQPVSDWCEQNGFDGIVIATDMEAPLPSRLHGSRRRMWITDETHGKHPYVDTGKIGEPMVIIPESDYPGAS